MARYIAKAATLKERTKRYENTKESTDEVPLLQKETEDPGQF
jgi:hypothetical protein